MYKHRYKQGKVMTPISFAEFEAALEHPYNARLCYRAFIVLLYYTGVRVSEALRTVKEDFKAERATLYWDVGKRLKHGRHTPPLPLNLKQPHMHLILEQLNTTKPGCRLFNFHRVTAWRHVKTGGLGYNHLARLSAITFFLKSGRNIAEIVNWFGISVRTVDSYIGDIGLESMGKTKRN